MPSVEPTSQVNEQSQSSSHQENASANNNGQSEQQQQQHQEPNQQSASNGEEIRDPDRQLIPADRIEHVEDSAAPVDLPTVREFTQNDKINKFLLNSFLQRLNETDLSQFRGNGDAADGEDQEQDFEA
ncbi:uncharacterized protein LOC109403741 [Aedes albopictus]|uniref:Uncharacterized protein n=1 Tax=Aedes albopictus TaxID=7160 RepID=A0ABM1Y5N4_AEDAL|nr:uncharacterized protein LOC109403741 [Aedes albopictus]XP_019532158.2 uncharacterized protein LOC109403741 [Aedes albopictus]XP_029716260.1 uncharacterized protein LOC115259632 [Aedes albopictus]